MKVVKGLLWFFLLLLAWHLWAGWEIAWQEELRIALAGFVCLLGIGLLGGNAAGAKWDDFSLSRISKRWLNALLWFGVAALVAIAAALFLRSPTEQLIVVWQETFPRATSKTKEKGVGEQQVSGNWLWTDGTRRSLPRKTNLKPGRKPEVFMRFDDSGLSAQAARRPLYVSAVHFDHYRNSSWEIDTQEIRTLQARRNGQIHLGRRTPRNGVWHTIVFSSTANQKSPLVGLQGLSRVEGLPRIEYWSDGFYILPPTGALGKGYRYRALSHPMRLEDTDQAKAPPPQQGRKDHWLALPDSALIGRVADLSARVAQGDDELSRARSIETFLRGNYGYSLQTTNRGNRDPLENFLFEEKSGHCEYFATAGALMARAVGIPARLVYGWAGGTWYEYANWFVFRADEAHAWVEVWLDDHGWVVMDPTPEAALRARGGRSPGEKLPSLPGADEELLEMDDDPHAPAEIRFPWAAASLLVALAFGGWLAMRRRPAAVELGHLSTEPWRETMPSHYFELWRKHCRSQHPGRDLRGSTLRHQLKWWQPEPEFADDLRDYHYAVRYQGAPPCKSQERALVKRIRIWAARFGNKS